MIIQNEKHLHRIAQYCAVQVRLRSKIAVKYTKVRPSTGRVSGQLRKDSLSKKEKHEDTDSKDVKGQPTKFLCTQHEKNLKMNGDLTFVYLTIARKCCCC